MTAQDVMNEVEKIAGIDFENRPENFLRYIKIILNIGDQYFRENQDLLTENSNLRKESKND